MCVRSGHNQGNLPQRVCEPVRASARFCGKFCQKGDTRGKGFLTRDCAQKLVPPGAQRYSCKESSGPWSTGVDRMIWVQVLPSFWNCRISCSSCIMLPQLTLIRKVYSPVTW